MVQSGFICKVPQDIDQLYVGRLALPQAVLLGTGDTLLTEPRKAGDGGVVGEEMAVEKGLQVPHELWLDGKEG